MLKILLESVLIDLSEGYDVSNSLVVNTLISQTFEAVEKNKFLTSFEKEVRDSGITKAELRKLYYQCVEDLTNSGELK